MIRGKLPAATASAQTPYLLLKHMEKGFPFSSITVTRMRSHCSAHKREYYDQWTTDGPCKTFDF